MILCNVMRWLVPKRNFPLWDSLTLLQVSLQYNHPTSSLLILNHSPQGCTISPLLCTWLTHSCVAHHQDDLTVKSADDTAVVELITSSRESAYRQEVDEPGMGCKENDRILNISETKDMILDFCKTGTSPPPTSTEQLWRWSPASHTSGYISPTTSPGVTTP